MTRLAFAVCMSVRLLALFCVAPWHTAVDCAADEPAAIFVMKLDGSEVRRVAEIDDYPVLGSPRWSHDAKLLAFDAMHAESKDRRIYIVGADGAAVRPLGPGSLADWSPDDKQLAFELGEQPATGQGLWVQNADGRGRLALSEVGRAPRWSPIGGALAALDGEALVIIDLVDGTRRKLEVPAGVLPGFDWSPDGSRLAFVLGGGDEEELWIVDVADSAKQHKLLSGDLGGYLAWSPDGRRLAIALAGKIHLLSADGSGAPQLVPEQQGRNSAPAWSGNGEWLAFASTRKTPALAPSAPAPPSRARIVRLEEVRRHTRGAVVYGLDLTLDGRKALLGGKRDLEIWDWNTDESSLAALRGEWVAMSPDGHTIAQSGPLVKIALGDLNTGKPIRDIFVGVMCSHVRFSPDGKRVVAGTIDKQAYVFDVASGKRICTFEKHQAPLTRVGFLPGGLEAVSSGQDEYVRVWNAETAEERLALKHPEVAWGLAISPDGRLIATGTGGHTFDSPILHKMKEAKENVIRLWDSASGELVRELKGHNDVIYSLIFSPDGRSVISGSWDATLRVWDVSTGGELTSIKGQGTIYALAITPDGTHILAGGGENRSAGQPIRRYRDEQVRVYRLIED